MYLPDGSLAQVFRLSPFLIPYSLFCVPFGYAQGKPYSLFPMNLHTPAQRRRNMQVIGIYCKSCIGKGGELTG
jgi:hypothetical protein